MATCCTRCSLGDVAFQGDTASDALARILEREPDWIVLPAATPAKVRELLRRCLEKDVNRRLRDIGDGRIELLDALTDAHGGYVSSEERFKVTRRTAIGGLAGAAAVAAGIGASAWFFWPRVPKQVMRLSMDVSPAQQFAGFT